MIIMDPYTESILLVIGSVARREHCAPDIIHLRGADVINPA